MSSQDIVHLPRWCNTHTVEDDVTTHTRSITVGNWDIVLSQVDGKPETSIALDGVPMMWDDVSDLVGALTGARKMALSSDAVRDAPQCVHPFLTGG